MQLYTIDQMSLVNIDTISGLVRHDFSKNLPDSHIDIIHGPTAFGLFLSVLFDVAMFAVLPGGAARLALGGRVR